MNLKKEITRFKNKKMDAQNCLNKIKKSNRYKGN